MSGRHGALIGAVFFASILYAVYQGGTLAWHLLGFLLVLAGIVVASQAGPLSSLQVVRHLGPGPYFAGDTLAVTLEVSSRRRWLWPHLSVIDHLPDDMGMSHAKFLIPHLKERAALHYQIPQLSRGVYQFETILAQTSDLFGLVTRTHRFEAPSRVVVWPSTISLVGTELFSRIWRGENLSPELSRQESAHLRGIREYVPGDRLSHIHWKTSAHTGDFKVKQFEPETKPEFTVVLEAARYFSDQEWELAVSAAASLVRFAQGAREAIGLAVLDRPDSVYAPAVGQNHLAAMMNLLASLDHQSGHTSPTLAPLDSRRVVIAAARHLDRWAGHADVVIAVGPGGLEHLSQLPTMFRPGQQSLEGGGGR